MLKLDYTITSPEERNKLVQQIIDESQGELPDKTLEIMADYLVLCMEKEEKKQRKILTDNRMATVTKREASLEGLVEKLENGEDGLYNLTNNDKNVILTPHVSITQKDLDEIPMLKQLRDSINQLEKVKVEGKNAYKLKKWIIELRQDQYIIKNAYRKPIYFLKTGRGSTVYDFDQDTGYYNEQGKYVLVSKNKIDLKNYEHVSAIIANYSMLKQNAEEDLNSHIRWMLKDLENIIDNHLEKQFPMYYDITVWKIDGKSNQEIQNLIKNKYDAIHSQEYISSLFRNKIPKIIADAVEEEELLFHYTHKEKGEWKTCTRCGETKLAHNRYFSRNKTAKSGFYSICKECRNKKK